MNNNATLLLPTGVEVALGEFDSTLGELIQLAQDALNDPGITADAFGALKYFFFVNSSTGLLIDSNLDLERPLSTLVVNDGHVLELRLCNPSPQSNGTVLNPMRGVTKYVT